MRNHSTSPCTHTSPSYRHQSRDTVHLIHLVISLFCLYMFNSGLGIRSSVFRAIARFLPKYERMSDSLKKTSNLLIPSFLVSNLSDLVTIAHSHFLWETWANRSWSLIFSERPEQFAHIVHFWWVTWAIRSHCSPKKREWANRCFFKIKKRI